MPALELTPMHLHLRCGCAVVPVSFFDNFMFAIIEMQPVLVGEGDPQAAVPEHFWFPEDGAVIGAGPSGETAIVANTYVCFRAADTGCDIESHP
jgi:hypothetical protein